jgi:Fe-S cluster biosynthesis and repair protein YggX
MVTLKTKKTKPEGKLTNSKHTKEIKLCNICYDEKNNKFIKCPKCKKNNSCRNCWESNIKIKSSINGDCLTLNCDYNSTREFIFNNFSKKFSKEWVDMQANKLIIEEKRLVEQSRRKMLNQNNNSNAFQFKCPLNNCGFFYTDTYNCTTCLKDICNECHKFKDSNHECKIDEKEEIKELMKNITQCPKCNEVIHKISGCNDMYCTKCNTHFNFITKRETKYRHNPHASNLNNNNNNNNETNNFLERNFYNLYLNLNFEMNKTLENYNDYIIKLRKKDYKECDNNLCNRVKLFDNLVKNEANKRCNNFIRGRYNFDSNLQLIQDDRLIEIEKSLGITERNLFKDLESDKLISILQINNDDKMKILSALKVKNYNLVNDITSKAYNIFNEENESIYNIGDKTLYYKLKNKIYIIDLESRFIKNVYILDDIYTQHKVIYVSENNIILYKKKGLIVIKRGEESKSMILDKKNEDNKINLNINFIIDINRKCGRIMMLCDRKDLFKEIVSLNLESGKVIKRWNIPSIFLNNCKNIVYVKWARLFIFNMINNLQIFNISHSRIEFLTVIVTDINKIFYDNEHNSEYLVGIHYKKLNLYNRIEYDKIHKIIDIKNVKFLKSLHIEKINKFNIDEECIYYESNDLYYNYNNTYNSNILYTKIDIKNNGQTHIFNKTKNSFSYFSKPSSNKHKFIPSLSIIISKYRLNNYDLPIINKFDEDYIKYEQNILNLVKNINILNNSKMRYNINDIHNYNRNVRNSFLRNRITEKTFKIKIKKNYSAFNKSNDLYNIINSVESSFKEILKKYKNRFISDRNNILSEIENTEKNLNKKLEDNYNIYGGDKFKFNILASSSIILSEIFIKIN